MLTITQKERQNLKDKVSEILENSLSSDNFNYYKEVYKEITGRAYNGQCTSCGLRSMLRVFKNFTNQ